MAFDQMALAGYAFLSKIKELIVFGVALTRNVTIGYPPSPCERPVAAMQNWRRPLL